MADGSTGFLKNVSILKAIACYRNGMVFSDILRSCDNIPRATLTRLLKSLCETGFIEKAEGRYKVGYKALDFARLLLGKVSLEDIIKPILKELAEITGESAAYYEYRGKEFYIVAKNEQPESFHYMESQTRNTFVTVNAFSRVILSYFALDKVKDILDHHEIHGRDRQFFLAKLPRYREQRYFPGKPENRHSSRIAYPVFDENNDIKGAIGISVPGSEVDKKRRDFFIEQAAKFATKVTETSY